jgi:hypothetical protein
MSIKSYPKHVLFVVFFFLLVMFTGGNASSQPMEPKALFEKRCSKCHTLDRTNKNESAEYWTATAKKMKSKIFSGISDEDVKIITDYLLQTRTGAFQSQGQPEQSSR